MRLLIHGLSDSGTALNISLHWPSSTHIIACVTSRVKRFVKVFQFQMNFLMFLWRRIVREEETGLGKKVFFLLKIASLSQVHFQRFSWYYTLTIRFK